MITLTVGFIVGFLITTLGFLIGFEEGKDWQFKHMLGLILDMDTTPLNAGERRHMSRDDGKCHAKYHVDVDHDHCQQGNQ